ncbi:hypothetical protein GCM10023350_19510 [Nocardioides endophyticus]|uniref:Uncharacterized protein n=2 Tax=Nocardioides endophyticus TaxID=1353775 RepID=A0ABP8YRL8_9ACTN
MSTLSTAAAPLPTTTSKDTDMNFSTEDLARAQVSTRLVEAQHCRQGRRLAQVISTGRRAEQVAQQARLAIARTL